MEQRLRDLREPLAGRGDRRTLGDPGPVSITRRLEVAATGNRASTYGPTPTHRLSLQIAVDEFSDVRASLDRLIRDELPALEERLDAAGVPWTPGRATPAPPSG